LKGLAIDTNVLATADRLADQADEDCITSCVDFLESVRQGLVLVDDGGRIVEEYGRNVSTGQPGPGAFFLRWLWANIANESVCLQVPITPIDQDLESYAEFPSDLELANFDPPDRKFAAVVLAYGGDAEVVNALDSDWRHAEDALARNGVKVRFLCPQHV
jgi:hypothetical protein